ncbi:MAG: Holliday junction resolvase RecU, partial [Lachnospiraceae bacterium]|nr:Holliday junction resolvase RecU [Lachnospiraceae bacterium]
MAESIGKKAEKKIKEWLDRPQEGYCFDRIPDPVGGYFGQRNICDFTCFKSPYLWYIESKATEHDNFPVSMLTDIQYSGLLEKSRIDNVFGVVIVLFVTYQRAFIFNILDLDSMVKSGQKSLNIKKIEKWPIPYREIQT